MERQERGQKKNQICIGLLAHVDAGKTTLAEQMLYIQGSIRRAGRVDHGDAFLDTYALERQRGITIFSKQALFSLGEKAVTLLDTPGHADFSAEMERTLQVLDYAVLIASGPEGIRGQAQTLWRLLERYRLPTFLLVNKMDQPGTDRAELMRELKARLSEHCVDFTQEADALQEEIAMCGEQALDDYLALGEVPGEEISRLIGERRLFPCYFGSALKGDGVAGLLEGLGRYTKCPEYGEKFAARVYKVSRDPQGNRLTHMKITGGSLRVKMSLAAGPLAEGVRQQEKVNQIRLYSGEAFETAESAPAGSICAVTGLSGILPGESLGAERPAPAPILQPVLSYRVLLPTGCDVHKMLSRLRQLEEEDPLLNVLWEEETGEILVRVMGQIQTEVLKSLIRERFGVEVDFGTGSIVYRETIREPVEGAGHYEPLRHYAEVRLLLEPLPPGSGLVFESAVSTDNLGENWQRLILSSLSAEPHRGVLTGAEVTDLKITLIAGRAHLKHTEGGDFRQAARRAVRQGLKKADCVLLEPVYGYRLEVPQELLGRAMSDITKMSGSFGEPESDGTLAVLTGSVPAAEAVGYPQEVLAYTRGQGHFSCALQGYAPCHNAQEILEKTSYDPEQDTANPTGSVFCSHGAGYYVPWDEVEAHMHTESPILREKRRKAAEDAAPAEAEPAGFAEGRLLDRELEEIFARTYGSGREERGWGRGRYSSGTVRAPGASGDPGKNEKKKDGAAPQEYLLVDGYNIIFAWKELKELAKENLAGARERLQDILCNYQGYRKPTLILVFDAYKLEGGQGSVEKYHNIYVVYTREAETADLYIERAVREISPRHHVTVATSDALEQIIIWGAGAARMSAGELLEEIRAASAEMRDRYVEQRGQIGTGFFEALPRELADDVEEVRLGRKEFEELMLEQEESRKKVLT